MIPRMNESRIDTDGPDFLDEMTADYTAEDPAFGGLMERHTLRRELLRVTSERDELAKDLEFLKGSHAHWRELAERGAAERDRLKDALQRTLWQIEHDPPLLPQAKEIAREALNGGED